MSRASHPPAGTGLAPFIASAAVLAAAGWILFVAGLHAHEMEVGAGALILTLVFLVVVRQEDCEPLDLRLKDVAQCIHIPWSIVARNWQITVLLFKDIFRIKRAGSFYRVCDFESSNHDPLLVARGVLATVYTTAAPNCIVIGIDPEQQRMLFHQIERTPVSKMTQSLGARP
jgi:hypothetical protein